MNTPGGLVTSTREIIADILASPVPVVGYVAPSGGHAASAGTYILYATHIAAMAPGTNLGAATPVEFGGPLPGLPGDGDRNKDSGGKPEKDQTRGAAAEDAMSAKMTNDLVAFIRSLAELRGRNADWAEKAVRDAATLSANAALEAHVIDLVARDVPELLQKIDGKTIAVAGSERRLATKGLAGRNAGTRLAHRASLGHHRSECRPHPDAGRHLWPVLRILEPRSRRARE